MTFEITSSGSLTRVIKFLGLLEELDYDTLRITGVELNLGASDTWGVEFNIEIIIQGA